MEHMLGEVGKDAFDGVGAVIVNMDARTDATVGDANEGIHF